MAIITTAIEDPLPGVDNPRRAITDTRLVKQNIIRQGISGWTTTLRRRTTRHDPATPKQIACRAPMRFGRAYYYNPGYVTKSLWNDVHPEDLFCEAVKRWLAGHSPAAGPYYVSDDPSTITIDATATASINAMILRFTPSDYCALWGVAIIRSQYPIVTPTWAMLRMIYPTTTIAERTWLDHPLAAGVWHYRFAACETDGKLGAFSDDVSDTVP